VRIVTLVLLLVVSCALVTTLLLLRKDWQGSSAAPAVLSQPLPSHENPSQDLVRPAEPLDVEQAPRIPSEPPVNTVAVQTPPAVAEADDFEKKYAGMAYDEIQAASAAIVQRLSTTTMEVLGQKIDRGEYDPYVHRPGESRTSEKTYPDGSTRLEVIRGGVEQPDGTQTWKIAHMRPEEDPRVLALWRESRWLVNRGAELRDSIPAKQR
jgi:hypothetical protein